jgi:hypothetical protein
MLKINQKRLRNKGKVEESWHGYFLLEMNWMDGYIAVHLFFNVLTLVTRFR